MRSARRPVNRPAPWPARRLAARFGERHAEAPPPVPPTESETSTPPLRSARVLSFPLLSSPVLVSIPFLGNHPGSERPWCSVKTLGRGCNGGVTAPQLRSNADIECAAPERPWRPTHSLSHWL